jgi:hypothetical protein
MSTTVRKSSQLVNEQVALPLHWTLESFDAAIDRLQDEIRLRCSSTRPPDITWRC